MRKIKDAFKKLFQVETGSLKILSIRSAIWSFLGKGGSHLIRIAGNLVLTRILFPEAFGLMATASTVVLVVQLFSDTGMNIAIIQNPRGDKPEYINSAWVIKVFRGTFLGLVILALAWPMSRAYGEPEVKSILLIMGLSPIILGFENPAIPLLIKKFEVSRQVGLEITTQLIALLTTTILAVLLKSVYALAIGYTISSIFRVVASYIVFPYRPSFKLQKKAAAELFNFGKFVFINTVITAAVLQADVFVVGKMLGMENLSFYNIGKNLGTIVMMFSVSMISQSFMPAVSSVQNDIQRVQRIFQRTTAFFLSISIPVSIVIVVFSDDIIQLLYDPRYQQSYISMYWLGLAGIVRIIGNISGVTFFAIGKPALETLSMLIGLICVAILLPSGAYYFGLHGAAFGMAVATGLIPLVESLFLVFGVKFSWKTVLRPWGQMLITTGACFGAFFLFRPLLDAERFYNIPFMVVMGLVSLAISASIWRYMEGPNPFRDYTSEISDKPASANHSKG